MLDYCIYLVYRAVVDFLSLLPLTLLFLLGRFTGWLAWLFAHNYRRLAWRNLEIAFGDELSAAARGRLLREHFQRLCANLLCSIKFTRWPIERTLARIRIENAHHIEGLVRSRQPFVLLLGHLSSWELCAQLLPQFLPEGRRATIYQRIRNPYIDAHIRAARARQEVEIFERSDGFGKVIDLLRSGGRVGILADQHAGDRGLWTPFFGRLASTTPLPALLAKRTGASILPFAIVTDGFARWRAVFEEPLSTKTASVKALTAAGNRTIERQIRREPADWFWVHNRWKTPIPNFLLPRYRRGIFVPDGQSLKPFRILIRSSNWLGDAVMSVPAVRAIKRGRPDAEVTIAAPEKLLHLWRKVEEADAVVSISGKRLFRDVRILRRNAPFDAAILFPNSLRCALEVWLAGVPRRIGFSGHARRWLLHQMPRRKKPAGPVHHATAYMQLAMTCGADAVPIEAGAPRRKTRTMRCALCPGAEYGPAKRWLPERFAEVAQEISRRHNVTWALFGTASDTAVGAKIASALGPICDNRIGQTTLEQLIAELEECDLLLTNDTGTMHLASLLGVPVVAIFGSTEPRLTAPFGSRREIIRHHVECSPCFLRECPLDFRCMREVQSDEVIVAVESVLRA